MEVLIFYWIFGIIGVMIIREDIMVWINKVVSKNVSDVFGKYELYNDDNVLIADLKFQDGPVKEFGVNGWQVEDIVDHCCYFIRSLNKGKFYCEYNDDAIFHLEKALHFLNERKMDRESKGIEGTSTPSGKPLTP